MYANMTPEIARQRVADLHRQADSYRLVRRATSSPTPEAEGRATFGWRRILRRPATV